GSVVHGSGRVVIFSDMLETVKADIPKAIALSLVMTVLAVLVAFGRRSASLAVLASLVVGLSLLAGYFVVFRVKVNFFNFIALPITFGIGVDYAVNLMQRYVADGEKRSILGAMRTTGGGVVLCSLTTTLGYLALIGSMNHAIR